MKVRPWSSALLDQPVCLTTAEPAASCASASWSVLGILLGSAPVLAVPSYSPKQRCSYCLGLGVTCSTYCCSYQARIWRWSYQETALIPAGEGKIRLLQWSITGYNRPYAQEYLDNTKRTPYFLWAFCFIFVFFVLFFCLFLFLLCFFRERKRKNIKLGGEAGGEPLRNVWGG